MYRKLTILFTLFLLCKYFLWYFHTHVSYIVISITSYLFQFPFLLKNLLHECGFVLFCSPLSLIKSTCVIMDLDPSELGGITIEYTIRKNFPSPWTFQWLNREVQGSQVLTWFRIINRDGLGQAQCRELLGIQDLNRCVMSRSWHFAAQSSAFIFFSVCF